MKGKKTSSKKIEVTLKKIASIEEISVSDTLKDHKYYFRKYNVSISEDDMLNYKKRSLRSIKKPYSMEFK